VTRRWLEVDGRRLAAGWIEPQGARSPAPVLVFLHEGLGSIAQWREFPRALAEAAGLPALVYDRLGYGESDAREEPFGPDFLHQEAFHTLPRVLETFGIQDTILVGHSDGGSIALLFAGDGEASHNVRVRGLISIASHVFVEPQTLASIARVEPSFQTTDVGRRLSRYHGEKTEALVRNWTGVWLSEGFRSFNIERALPAIPCPVLALQGSEDEYGTAAQIEAIRQGAGAHVKMLPGCGHAPHRQAPEAALEQMRAFIESILGGQARS